jgi:hypothetical protein
MSFFSVIIDGRNLFNNRILLIDSGGNTVNNDWIDISSPLNLSLAPGEYRFSSQASLSDFSFTINTTGLIILSPDTTEFMQVINDNTLKITGYAVKIDARYLTGDGIAMPTAHAPAAGDGFANGFIKHERINLLPGLAYYITTASGMVSNFFIKLGVNREWQVLNPETMLPDNIYDNFITCINGSYTPEIIIYGYPVLIDGRSAKCPLRLIDLVGTASKGSNHANFDDEGVFFVNLIPQRREREGFEQNDLYRFETETHNYSEPGFYITIDGKIGFDPLYGLYFTVDKFNGLARLNVIYPLPDRIA